MGISRRELLQSGAVAAGAFAVFPAFIRDALAQAGPGPSPYGELGAADANGLQLPSGFTSRRIAVAGQPVGSTSYTLPIYPDGQATFKTIDGGWILVTNAEAGAAEGGGVSAIRFAEDGTITNAYRILGNTVRNCAGGPTPWGTWLTGEETAGGLIWECDPAGKLEPQARPALGVYSHEAAAVDPVGKRVYLTEDHPAGGLYRFTPTTYPDLSAGTLEVAQVAGDSSVSWHVVPDPTTTQSGTATRQQVPQMSPFNGGEGLWYAGGVVYFTTKGDRKVWAYTPGNQRIEILYDHAATPGASLNAVDNVTVGAAGDVLVCEDGGNMEVGIITPDKLVSPLLRFSGAEHAASEICGVVFNPASNRMYVTSQRAEITAGAQTGAVYEISGPFRIPAGGVPADLVYGPPIGEPAPTSPPPPAAGPPAAIPDTRQPFIRVSAGRRIRRPTLLSRGIEVRVTVDEASAVAIAFDSRALKRSKARRPVNVVLARARRQHPGEGRQLKIRLRLSRTARTQLRRASGQVRARILVSARDAAGNESTVVKAVTIGRAG